MFRFRSQVHRETQAIFSDREISRKAAKAQREDEFEQELTEGTEIVFPVSAAFWTFYA